MKPGVSPPIAVDAVAPPRLLSFPEPAASDHIQRIVDQRVATGGRSGGRRGVYPSSDLRLMRGALCRPKCRDHPSRTPLARRAFGTQVRSHRFCVSRGFDLRGRDIPLPVGSVETADQHVRSQRTSVSVWPIILPADRPGDPVGSHREVTGRVACSRRSHRRIAVQKRRRMHRSKYRSKRPS